MLTLSGVVYHENLILFPFVAEEESWHKPVVICVKLLKIVDQCPHVYDSHLKFRVIRNKAIQKGIFCMIVPDPSLEPVIK